jgi:hypothetical protein
MNSLTQYERKQLREIRSWKRREPSVASKAMTKALAPVSWLVNKLIPTAAIQGVLSFSSSAARFLTDTDDIIRAAGVRYVHELRNKNLELSDSLANSVHNWAIGFAVTEGAATGTCGLPGLVVDIPAIITLAFRTIHKIGVCYGFEAETKSDKDFVLAILAASGSNSLKEKAAAIATLRQIEVTIAKKTWKSITEKAAEEKFGQEAAIIGIKELAEKLGVNLTKRKALESIPGIGGAIGGTVNGNYIREVGWAARRSFQERWLLEHGKVT